MAVTDEMTKSAAGVGTARHAVLRPAGLFWLALATLAAAVFFREGIGALLAAWQLVEYSHGPLIPVLSLFLFLRQLKTVPVRTGAVPDRWPGVALMLLALLLGFAGKMIGINDIVAYALILWVGAVLLISFGWRTGREFWPPVVHLVYMLPLPGALYYGLSTSLQGVSSELGVWFLHLLRVPVFLDGNVIDLGDYKLLVAEACSGLRYLFPILSFSYIFAVLYQGPMWHKAVLLLSAAPITILMNSVRIAITGVVAREFGIDAIAGLTHFLEGWVIFVTCVLLLFALAWALNRLRRNPPGLLHALDLDTAGLGAQAMRLKWVQPSAALVTGALAVVVSAAVWQALPQREPVVVNREPFALFPARLGTWEAGSARMLDADTTRVLAADDYHSVSLRRGDTGVPVDLFMAWYKDQMTGGVHSPEVCLPGAGWEIARLEQIPMPAGEAVEPGSTLNRVLIQNGLDLMLVYYWYEQQGNRTASAFAAKLDLMTGKILNGRNDSAIVRLITPIASGETEADAEARLQDSLHEVLRPLPDFVPGV